MGLRRFHADIHARFNATNRAWSSSGERPRLDTNLPEDQIMNERNHTPAEANMHLIRKPKKPRWRPFVQFNIGHEYHDSWKHFLDIAYWNVELGE